MSWLHSGGTKLGSVLMPCRLDNDIHHWHGSYTKTRDSRNHVHTFSIKLNVEKKMNYVISKVLPWPSRAVGSSISCIEFSIVKHFLSSFHYISVHLTMCVCVTVCIFMCVFLSDATPHAHPLLPSPPAPMQIRTSHTSRQAAECSVISHDQLMPSWQLCEQFH